MISVLCFCSSSFFPHDIINNFFSLIKAGISGVSLSPLTSSRILVRISDPSSVDHTVQFLSEQPEVHFLQTAPKYRTFNRFSAGATQTGADVADQGSTPYWAEGLNGNGLVVAVGDSGYLFVCLSVCLSVHLSILFVTMSVIPHISILTLLFIFFIRC